MECFYHGDKFLFGCIQKDLRKIKLMSKIYADRLAMAVCSCRRKRKSTESEITAERSVIKDTLLKELENNQWDSYLETKHCLTDLAERIYLITPSQLILLQIIYQSLSGDFSIVKDEVRPQQKKTKRRHKISTNVLHIILKKKKKSYPSEEVILPLFGGNSRELTSTFDDGLLGIGKKYDCVLDIDGKKTKVFMDKGLKKTVMKIWYRDYAKFETLKDLLQHKATEIQTAFTRRRIRRYNPIRLTYYNDPDDFWTDVAFQKGRMSDDFDKKDYKTRRNKGWRRHDKVDVLNGGHCQNCLKEYVSIKATSECTCTYHSGYIKVYNDFTGTYYKWTCCAEENFSRKPTHSDHNSAGCKVGVHNWRLHKKASRYGKKQFSEQHSCYGDQRLV